MKPGASEKSRAARVATIAITTRSSMSEKADFELRRFMCITKRDCRLGADAASSGFAIWVKCAF